jgi:hypothetical protein
MTLAKALSSSAAVDAAMAETEALARLEKSPDYAFLLATSDVGTPTFCAAVRAKRPTLPIVILAPSPEAKTRVDPNVFAILDDNTSSGDLVTTVVIASESAPAAVAVPSSPKAESRPLSSPAPLSVPRPEVFDVEKMIAEEAEAPDPVGEQTVLAVKALGRLFRLVDVQEYRTNLRYSQHVGLILRATRSRPTWPGICAALARSLGHAGLAEGLREKLARNQPLVGLEKQALERADAATRTVIEVLPGADLVQEVLDHVHFRYDGRGAGGAQNVRTGENIAAGARALRLAIDYDQCIRRGLAHEEAMRELRTDAGRYDPRMLMAVDELETPPPPDEAGAVAIKSTAITAGAVLAEPLYGIDGNIVFKEGHAMSEKDVARVLALSHEHRIRDHVLVARR